jgi:hypothetical protein
VEAVGAVDAAPEAPSVRRCPPVQRDPRTHLLREAADVRTDRAKQRNL